MATQTPRPRGGFVVEGLSGDDLEKYLDEFNVVGGQIVSITEPSPGKFTLIYSPDMAQRRAETERRQNMPPASVHVL